MLLFISPSLSLSLSFCSSFINFSSIMSVSIVFVAAHNQTNLPFEKLTMGGFSINELIFLEMGACSIMVCLCWHHQIHILVL